MRPTKIAVVGSREYPDLFAVRKRVWRLPSDVEVVSGRTLGVDSTAQKAAMSSGLRRKTLGKAREIVEYAEYVIAFWDGKSDGTRELLEVARELGVGTSVILPKSTVITPSSWKDKRIGVFDTETTGVNPWRHELMEMGLVVVEKGKVLDKVQGFFQTRVMPDAEVRAYTGITERMVASGLSTQAGPAAIVKALRGVEVLVAHNAPFDRRFLTKYLTEHRDVGWDAGSRIWVDTLVWSKLMWPDAKSYKLGECLKRLGVRVKKSSLHRALYDAEMNLELLRGIIHVIPDDVESLYVTQKNHGSIHGAWVDKAYRTQPGRFSEENGEVVVGFGKFKGETLSYLARHRPWYVRWMLEKMRLSEEERGLVLSATAYGNRS